MRSLDSQAVTAMQKNVASFVISQGIELHAKRRPRSQKLPTVNHRTVNATGGA